MSNEFASRISIIPILIITMVFFLYKKIFTKDSATKDITRKYLIGMALMVIWTMKNAIEVTSINIPWFIHSISNSSFHISILIIYFSIYQTLYDKLYHPLVDIRSKTSIATILLSFSMVIVDIARYKNYISPTNTTIVYPDILHLLGYSLYFIALFPAGIGVVAIYLESIINKSNLIYKIRYSICALCYFIGITIIIAAEVNIILLMNYKPNELLINWVQQTGPFFCFITGMIGVLPHSFYSSVLSPFTRFEDKRYQNNISHLIYLHKIMSQITPNMICVSDNPDILDTDILVEISDMRHIILSHYSPEQYQTSRQEAELIYKASKKQKRFTTSGPFNPILHRNNVFHYNIQVSIELQKIKQKRNIRMMMKMSPK